MTATRQSRSGPLPALAVVLGVLAVGLALVAAEAAPARAAAPAAEEYVLDLPGVGGANRAAQEVGAPVGNAGVVGDEDPGPDGAAAIVESIGSGVGLAALVPAIGLAAFLAFRRGRRDG